MPNVMLSPPTNQLSTTTYLFGQAYTCAIGQAIAVPDNVSSALRANGWYEAPFGTSAQRPAITPQDRRFFLDLTLGKLLCAIAGVWVDTGIIITGTASTPGGGPNNTADMSDPNNAYLANVGG